MDITTLIQDKLKHLESALRNLAEAEVCLRKAERADLAKEVREVRLVAALERTNTLRAAAAGKK